MAASSETDFGSKSGTSKYLIPGALIDLKFPNELAAGDAGTSNGRHKGPLRTGKSLPKSILRRPPGCAFPVRPSVGGLFACRFMEDMPCELSILLPSTVP